VQKQNKSSWRHKLCCNYRLNHDLMDNMSRNIPALCDECDVLLLELGCFHGRASLDSYFLLCVEMIYTLQLNNVESDRFCPGFVQVSCRWRTAETVVEDMKLRGHSSLPNICASALLYN